MIRGTTPTITFTLPFDVSFCSCVWVTFAQGDKEVLTKATDSCTLEGNTVSVRLTQEETLSFDCKQRLQIQICVLTPGGDVVRSDIIETSVSKCLKAEVIA